MNFNRNDKQLYFNQIRGEICELNDDEKYCSITLICGHENTRKVNFCISKHAFDVVSNKYKLADKILIKFYVTSSFKNGRWYSALHVLEVLPANSF